jgi:hypothetical protein
LACESLLRAVYRAAASTPAIVTIEPLEQGLHDRPGRLRRELQARIDAAGPTGLDAVLLAYALCGGATAGLVAGAVPLVVPRAHDCITLHLGSRARYDEEFAKAPGTYWMNRALFEHDRGIGPTTLGVGPDGYADLVTRYGEDNAAFLAEAMQGWAAHYERIVYLTGDEPEPPGFHAEARRKADGWGLSLCEQRTDHRLVTALLAGEWDEEFLVVPPGHRIARATGPEIVTEQTVTEQTVTEQTVTELKEHAG